MKKVLMIGIDSLDLTVLKKYENSLPTFTKLRRGCPEIKSESVFPVDSIPAWSTIYTGLNPAKHGIVKAFDVFDSDLQEILKVDYSVFRGKTFWDYVSKAGKRACVLFPMLTFPPWDLNGIMISKALSERKVEGGSKWLTENETLSFPSWIANKYNIPNYMKGISGKHPGIENLIDWAEDGKKVLLNEAELGLKICKNEDWDLFFIYFSWLDIIQHRLWRFFDTNDPSYPGINKYENIIKEFYILLDKIVAEFINLYPDLPIIVFSDHGHEMRPTKVVNLNKVLLEEKLLFPESNGVKYSQYAFEKIKLTMLDFVKQFELDCWLVDFSTKTKTLSSLSKKAYTSTSSNSSSYMCHLSSFAGIKSYSHGGIEIERSNLKGYDYESFRNSIINKLLSIKNPETEEELFDWVCKREELYDGPKVCEVYPDIVFRLKAGYGTGWNLYSSLIGTAYDHNLASGGHRKEAVFLISNLKKTILKENMTLMDVAPTVLYILEISKELHFDGSSIISD